MNGKGNLVLTGQLGDVMKESAQAALSFIRARARWLGLEDNFLEKSDLHLHIPAGAIPKDGPSAGVTMYVSMVSLLTGKPVRNDVGQTGRSPACHRAAGGRSEKFLDRHRAGTSGSHALPEPQRLIDIPSSQKEMDILRQADGRDPPLAPPRCPASPAPCPASSLRPRPPPPRRRSHLPALHRELGPGLTR